MLATWWVGLILGVGLAFAAPASRRPPRPVRSLVRPVVRLLLVTGGCAAVMGVVGYGLGSAGAVVLVGPLAPDVPPEKYARFLAALWAHPTSYAVGFAGGLVVLVRVWHSRR